MCIVSYPTVANLQDLMKCCVHALWSPVGTALGDYVRNMKVSSFYPVCLLQYEWAKYLPTNQTSICDFKA